MQLLLSILLSAISSLNADADAEDLKKADISEEEVAVLEDLDSLPTQEIVMDDTVEENLDGFYSDLEEENE